MKSIYKSIMLGLAACTVAVSCDVLTVDGGLALNTKDPNKPAVFDDANAFVAFDKATMSCSEDDVDIVKIPVTLASLAGIEESIGFTVTEPEEKAAKAGVNYNLLTTSGVLSFSKNARTQYIELKVKYDGEYTGDLKLVFTINAGATVQTGSTDKCTLTISDVDHPLAPILGDYVMSGEDYWDGPASWKLTLYKDAEDDHKIWFENLYNNSGWIGDDMRFSGIVTMDGITPVSIYLPFGQEAEYKYSGKYPVTLYGIDSDLMDYDTGGVTINITYPNGKAHLDFGEEYGFWLYIEDNGSVGIVKPGLSADKL